MARVSRISKEQLDYEFGQNLSSQNNKIENNPGSYLKSNPFQQRSLNNESFILNDQYSNSKPYLSLTNNKICDSSSLISNRQQNSYCNCCCLFIGCFLMFLLISGALASSIVVLVIEFSKNNATTTLTTTSMILTATSQVNWIVNGDAENGPCDPNNGITSPTNWNYIGAVSQSFYNVTNGALLYTDPGPSNRGHCFFAGGKKNSTIASMFQTQLLTPTIDSNLIDNQKIYFNLSAWIGGFKEQDDNAQIAILFRNQINQQVGNTLAMGPILAADRNNLSSLLYRQSNGFVPIGARSFIITVTMNIAEGGYNDGSIDNIALSFYQ